MGARGVKKGSFVRLVVLLAALVCATAARAQGDVVPPMLEKLDGAEYPGQALFRGIETDIGCQVELDDHGGVTKALCDTTEDAAFGRGARDALRAAHFKPAQLRGTPAAAHLRFVYRFLINRERAGDPPPFTEAGVIEGQVLAQGTRANVVGADVIVQGLGLVATTDLHGRFSVKVPAGVQTLVIVSADYYRTQVKAEAGKPPDTIYLRKAIVSDTNSITVTADRQTRVAPTKETVTREELRNVPGTQGDPVRVLENLPGLARVPFTGGQLIVRGAAAVDTGAYIDGQKIPILYHLLNGPSVMGEEMVDKIDFYPGGAGVYYGRNLAGVVAIQSRKGSDERWHGSLASDLQKSALFLQGPVTDSSSVAFGVRRSYINPAVEFFADKNKELTLPVYWDYQARGDVKSGRNKFTLLAYGSDDSFQTVGGGRGSVPLELGKRIGFHRAKLSWERSFSDAFRVSVAPMVGYDLSDSTSSGAGPGVFARPQSQQERTFSSGLRADATLKKGDNLEFRSGVDILFDRVAYDLDILFDSQLRGVGAPNAEEARLSGVRVFGNFGEFAELEIKAGRLRITPGLRLEQLHWVGHTYALLDPRLWARFEATESLALYAYGGLYHQAPTAEQVDPTIGNPGLQPMASEQVGAGFERRFGDLWSVKAEGYLSLRRNLVFPAAATANGDGTYSNPLQSNSGLGRSIGLEVLIRREFTERLYGWVAYTLSRSRELPTAVDAWRPTAFDQPHILTFLVGYRPSPYIEFATRVRIATGNPLAEPTDATFDADSGNYVPTLKPFGTTRLPTFVQVDFEVNNIWVGDVGRLQLYIDFQNVLNRTNAESIAYDFRYAQSEYVHGLPFLASVGAKVSF